MREGDSRIANTDITASTSWEGYDPQQGRLNYTGGWGPNRCWYLNKYDLVKSWKLNYFLCLNIL